MQMRRFWEDVFPYHLITTTKGKAKLLADPEKAAFIRDYLLEARRRDDIMLLAYCIMPEHVHLCIVPRKKDPSTFMMNLKLMCVSRFKLGAIWEKRFFDKRIPSFPHDGVDDHACGCVDLLDALPDIASKCFDFPCQSDDWHRVMMRASPCSTALSTGSRDRAPTKALGLG